VIDMIRKEDLKEGDYVILIKDPLSKDGSDTGFKKGMLFKVIDPKLRQITQIEDASLFIKVESCKGVPTCTHISEGYFHTLQMATPEEVFLAHI